MNLSKLDSPLGKLLLVTDEHARIRVLDFADHQAHLHRVLRQHYVRYELIELPGPHGIVTALQLYFDGELAALDGIATATAGSELQHQVWAALRSIQVGQTVSYGKLARAVARDCFPPKPLPRVGCVTPVEVAGNQVSLLAISPSRQR